MDTGVSKVRGDDSLSFCCESCKRSFQTSHGLKIHQLKKHEQKREREKGEESEKKEPEKKGKEKKKGKKDDKREKSKEEEGNSKVDESGSARTGKSERLAKKKSQNKGPVETHNESSSESGSESNSEIKKKNRRSPKKTPKKNDKKEDAFGVKDRVCVDLTGLKRFENNNFCHMDGVIVKRKEDGSFVVLLDDLKEEVDAEQDHLEPRRDADPREKWEKGDAVQVLETNSGIDGWWDATVVKKSGKKWQVKWRGEYEAHGDLSTVDAKKMRRALKK